MDSLGQRSILPVEVSVAIDTMLNLDSDFDGHGDVTYEQTDILVSHMDCDLQIFGKHRDLNATFQWCEHLIKTFGFKF